MASLQSEAGCQSNDLNNQFPMEVESSLRFPLDSSMRIIFTGYYNGFGVEVRGIEEMSMLYHMGCFGKSTKSKSRPKAIKNDESPQIMRKRQYLKRNYWFKKFEPTESCTESNSFINHVDSLLTKLLKDSASKTNDVIDLVSSDDGDTEQNDTVESKDTFTYGKQATVVIVPNSDSEDDNYFLNLKPKCCVNRIKLEEKLMLTKQEAFFLVYGLGCLQVLDSENKVLKVKDCWKLFAESDSSFIRKYVVYHYYRSKGYIVKPGIKFGGDYLLYREGPGINHSDFIVVIKHEYDDYNTWLSILAHVRMAVTTLKEILTIEVIEPNANMTLPNDLNKYTVKELLLTRHLPVVINAGKD
ncbi:unnamed protein product [Leptosia nina]|uniref:tRNA-splicing endonuclease subunit Sen2 n=1 Tax=Leptosia nina TaxID=320188 RepID=A0AAV1K5C8_9NEOP